MTRIDILYGYQINASKNQRHTKQPRVDYDQEALPHACVGRTMADMVNWRTNLGKSDFYKHKAKLNQYLQQSDNTTKLILKESKLKSYQILYRRHIGPDKPTLRGNLPPAARTNCGQALSPDQAPKHNDSTKGAQAMLVTGLKNTDPRSARHY